MTRFFAAVGVLVIAFLIGWAINTGLAWVVFWITDQLGWYSFEGNIWLVGLLLSVVFWTLAGFKK